METRFAPELVAMLDLDSIEIESGSFVDPSLSEKYSDVLLAMKTRPGLGKLAKGVLVYVLFEHKSEPERYTVFQMLAYLI